MTYHDETLPDDEFCKILAELDDKIFRGVPVESSALTGNGDLHPRIKNAYSCLELLHQVWPQKHVGPGPNARIAQQIGRFVIEKELGHGGHGFVYLAHDPRLKRKVAIKVPRPEVVAMSSMRRRFQREAELAAQLEHQNLVAIYEVDFDGPIIFLVSEYCPGLSLAAWLRSLERPASTRTSAEIVGSLASAVDYMHGRGILHRDIKPGNVLLTSDGSLGEDPQNWIPKLTDFGLAILAESDSRQTRTGALIGTLAYMAPEQVESCKERQGPHSDIYALGVVLYECLTGRPPFVGATDADVLRQLLSDSPIPPRRLRLEVPHDLEVICLKCLEKDSRHRYETAGDLALDLKRFLVGEPIKARPVGSIEKCVKWIRRRPAIATMSAMTLIVTIGLLSLGVWYGITLRRHEAELRTALERMQRSEQKLLAENYAVEIRTAQSLTEGEMRTNLVDVLERLAANDHEYRHQFEWSYLRNVANDYQILRGHRRPIGDLDMSQDGRFVATAAGDGTVRIWEIASRKQIAEWAIDIPTTHKLFFTRDGKHVSVIRHVEPDSIFCDTWEIASGKSFRATLPEKMNWTSNFLRGPTDDEILVFGGNVGLITSRIIHWNHRTGFVRDLKLPSEFMRVTARLSSDGRFLTLSGAGPDVFEWDLLKDAHPKSLPVAAGPDVSMARSNDNQSVAIGTVAGRVELWDLKNSERVKTWDGLGGRIYDIEFDPTEKYLAVVIGSPEREVRDRELKVIDLSSKTGVVAELKPDAFFTNLKWTPDSSTLAIGCFDHHVRLWRPFNPPSSTRLNLNHGKEAWGLGFSPDGSRLAIGYDDEANGDRESLTIWELSSGIQPLILEGHQGMVSCVRYAQDGTRLYSASDDKSIRIWNGRTGAPLGIVGSHKKAVRGLAISADGNLLASCGRDCVANVWDLQSGQLRYTFNDYRDVIRDVTFSPDGKLLVTCDNSGEVRIWNMSNGEHVKRLLELVSIAAIAIRGDSKLLATGNQDGYMSVYELDHDSRLVTSIAAHRGGIRCVAFSPDGRCVVTGGLDRSVKFWHLDTGREILSFTELSAPVNRLEFTADGNHLAASLLDGEVQLWHATPSDKSFGYD